MSERVKEMVESMNRQNHKEIKKKKTRKRESEDDRPSQQATLGLWQLILKVFYYNELHLYRK